jgi:hypothetical protein
MNAYLVNRLRQCLGALIFVASILCAPYLFFLGAVGAILPPVVSSALAVFCSVGLTVLSVSLGSPASLRRNLEIWVAVVALVLWITALLLWQPYALSRREPLLSVLLAAVGVIGVTLWLMPRDGRIARQRLCAAAFLMTFVALLGITLVDWPVWPDAVPQPLLQATGGHRDAIERFHYYYLGGFIDHDWLWRIDARPEVLQTITEKLGLSKVANAPPDFWLMPPYYWPQSLPPGAQLYSTPGFSRGAGDQYLMLVDAQRGLAVVWVKQLFG